MLLILIENSFPPDLSRMYWSTLEKFIFLLQIPYVILVNPFLFSLLNFFSSF